MIGPYRRCNLGTGKIRDLGTGGADKGECQQGEDFGEHDDRRRAWNLKDRIMKHLGKFMGFWNRYGCNCKKSNLVMILLTLSIVQMLFVGIMNILKSL